LEPIVSEAAPGLPDLHGIWSPDLQGFYGLVNISETEYRGNYIEDGETSNISIVFLDSSTISIKMERSYATIYASIDFFFKSVGSVVTPPPNGSAGGGCNSGGSSIFALLLPTLLVLMKKGIVLDKK